jgi:hypothetical protein
MEILARELKVEVTEITKFGGDSKIVQTENPNLNQQCYKEAN